jgi:hypothetical protein
VQQPKVTSVVWYRRLYSDLQLGRQTLVAHNRLFRSRSVSYVVWWPSEAILPRYLYSDLQLGRQTLVSHNRLFRKRAPVITASDTTCRRLILGPSYRLLTTDLRLGR